jgi:multidrug resistance efflux pump
VPRATASPGAGAVEVRRDRPAAGGRADARAKAAQAQVEQAQAQLDQAELNLSYTKIVAPGNGIITRKSVEIDQNVSAGQNLLTLVSLEDLWVTANFKETQLRTCWRQPASRSRSRWTRPARPITAR